MKTTLIYFFILPLLVLPRVCYSQETVPVDSSVNAFVFKDFKEPQFKGKDFSVAIYNYFYSGDAFYFGSKPKSKEPSNLNLIQMVL